MQRFNKGSALLLASAMLVASPVVAASSAAPDDATVKMATTMLTDAIAIPTVQGRGKVPVYARYLADRLIAAGYAKSDIEIVPVGETAYLVARWPGTGKGKGKGKPILLSGHMDVVEANPADWERDPFTPVIENGFVYGRGSNDNKFGVTMMVATLIRLKQEGFKPKRDLILTLSGDEETEMETTRQMAPRFKGAEMLLNSDGGGGMLGDDGKAVVYGLQAGEKTYADFDITFTNPGGHSSRPSKDNAIYRLGNAISKIAAYDFPPMQNELTKAFFAATAKQLGGKTGEMMQRFVANRDDKEAVDYLSSDPEFVGQVRTTCVGTMLNGGHALNALPQKATLSVNCRIFPGVAVDAVRDTLKQVVADDAATITTLGQPAASDASPLRKDVLAAVRKAVDERYPGLPIVPNMSAGATDSLYFRALGVPSYGVGDIFIKPTDDFAHGLNERVPVDGIPGALAQWHRLLTELAK